MAAKERDAVSRQLFADLALTLDADKVIVVDESSTHRAMTSAYARAPQGERASEIIVRNYGTNVSLIAGLRLTGMDAPLVIEGPVNTAVFEAYVEHVLASNLAKGDIVILDNLSCHKSKTTRRLIEARGARLILLPPYSPDLSPIEQAFAKIKSVLRRLRAQTLDALIDAIGQALAQVSALDALGFFTDCGFLNIH
jgi:transposase